MSNQNDAGVMFVVLLIVGCLTIIADAALFVAWAIRKDQVDAGFAKPLFSRTWSLVDVWIIGQAAIVITLVISIAVTIVAMIATGSIPFQGSNSAAATTAVLAVSLIGQNLALGTIPLINIRKRYKVDLREIGVKLLPSQRDLVLGVGAGLALLVASAILESTLISSVTLIAGPGAASRLSKLTESLTVESILKGGMSPGLFLVMLVGAGILAPIGEEIFFRGFLYNAAKRRFGLGWGIAISSAIFALVHVGPLAVCVIFFMGAWLAVMYEWTGSLWVSITMHAFINSTQVLLVYFAPHLVK